MNTHTHVGLWFWLVMLNGRQSGWCSAAAAAAAALNGGSRRCGREVTPVQGSVIHSQALSIFRDGNTHTHTRVPATLRQKSKKHVLSLDVLSFGIKATDQLYLSYTETSSNLAALNHQ